MSHTRQKLIRLKNSQLDTLISLCKKKKHEDLKIKLINFRDRSSKQLENGEIESGWIQTTLEAP